VKDGAQVLPRPFLSHCTIYKFKFTIERHEHLGWLSFRNRLTNQLQNLTWATKCSTLLFKGIMTVQCVLVIRDSRHVCAIPWPSGRWRARRRIDTGIAGRLHSRERTRATLPWRG